MTAILTWDCVEYLTIIILMTRSDQPEPPAVAIVRQNGLSSASSRASVADTPVSRKSGGPRYLTTSV